MVDIDNLQKTQKPIGGLNGEVGTAIGSYCNRPDVNQLPYRLTVPVCPTVSPA